MIIEKLQERKSVEAQLCIDAFQYAKNNLNKWIWESSRELRERGFAEDVTYSASLAMLQVVPILQNDWFMNFFNHFSGI
ncbi:hypothetical protein V7024_14175 [Bacillus sp. JJ864]|uniref:hypothetical protein n=1 Tax=Bacillus sp. JJ864 TaxID=3122975 RepID=UPI003000B6AD